MTIIGIARGDKDYNALVVDTRVGDSDGAGGLEYRRENEKLQSTSPGVYVAIAGDELVLDAVHWLGSWLDPEILNLADPRAFHAILAIAERLRRVRIAQGHDVVADVVASIVAVATRDDVYYWHAAFEPGKAQFSRPSAPVKLERGALGVIHGGKVEVVPFRTTTQDPFDPIMSQLVAVDREFSNVGRGLTYEFGVSSRFSGVKLPHSKSRRVVRHHPFANMAEQMVRWSGAEAALSLLADAEFMALPFEPQHRRTQ